MTTQYVVLSPVLITPATFLRYVRDEIKQIFIKKKIPTHYWVGALKLSDVSTKQEKYPLLFFNEIGELEYDKNFDRDDNGVTEEIFLYDFWQVFPQLLSCQSRGYQYIFFLVEQVEIAGVTTSYIVIPQQDTDTIGFYSWRKYNHQDITRWAHSIMGEKVIRIKISM